MESRSTPPSRVDRLGAAWGMILVWGVGDGVSTVVASRAVGPSLEANPLMALALHVSPAFAFSVNLAAVILAAVLFHAGFQHIQVVPYWRVWAAVVLAIGVLTVAVNGVVALSA